MKDFRSRGAIFSVTARFLHSSLFSFSFNRFSAAAFSCARSLAAGFAGGPIVKFWLCAMTASGHAAAAPPRSVMKLRPYGQKIKTAAKMTVVQASTMEQLSAAFPTAPHGSS